MSNPFCRVSLEVSCACAYIVLKVTVIVQKYNKDTMKGRLYATQAVLQTVNPSHLSLLQSMVGNEGRGDREDRTAFSGFSVKRAKHK